MKKTCKGVRAEWPPESLKLAACAVSSGNSLAAASKLLRVVPRRILRDWVSRDTSLEELGSNAVMPADVEESSIYKLVLDLD
jgi:hypothetical protein